jgi:hypothetical protein
MTGESSESSSTGNGKKPLDWPTLVLILVTGGGNFLAGQQGKNALSYEQQEAMAKIRDLHAELNTSQSRQLKMLENQERILENDTVLLKELHDTVQQMRRAGSP